MKEKDLGKVGKSDLVYNHKAFYFFKSESVVSNIGSSGDYSLHKLHSNFPVFETGLLLKIASTELHLPPLLCLHLPEKAIRLELSSIWFSECTYLYLSHVYHGSIRRLHAPRSMQCPSNVAGR